MFKIKTYLELFLFFDARFKIDEQKLCLFNKYSFYAMYYNFPLAVVKVVMYSKFPNERQQTKVKKLCIKHQA